MVAVSFGGYATSLFVGEHASKGWDNLFITALILGMLGVNLIGAKFVASAQSLIVAVVLAVFAVFICATIVNLNPDLLAFSGYPSLSKIVASVALTFFAYLGFNVITFTAGDLRNPAHDLPRAMTYALGITSVVYVLIAVGVFGTLTTTQVIGYGETAIASVGSAVALMVFLLVGIAGWRRRADTNGNPVIVALAIAATGIVLGFFAVDTLQTAPETFTAIILLGLLAIVLDALVRRHRRTPDPPEGRPSPSASPSG